MLDEKLDGDQTSFNMISNNFLKKVAILWLAQMNPTLMLDQIFDSFAQVIKEDHTMEMCKTL